MSDDTNMKARAEALVFDHAAYTKVVIYVTGEIEGHTFKRGTVHMVDGETFEALTKAGLLSDPFNTTV